MPKIEVNDITLNYKETGKGKPIILLHGNGEDLHIFDKLTDKLKKHYCVYAIDSRNHGKSSQTDDYSYETMAHDIFCFIKELDLKKVSVIGFSDGAIISLLLELKYEGLFNKMALLGINLKPTDFRKKEYNFLMNAYTKTKDPLIKLMLEQPNIELEELNKIKTPVLVIAGQNDIFYRKTFINITNAIEGAYLKIMKGHDHGSYIADTDILYPDLIEFLQ